MRILTLKTGKGQAIVDKGYLLSDKISGRQQISHELFRSNTKFWYNRDVFVSLKS